MTFRYLADICNLPGDLLAEVILCLALLSSHPGLHPLWLIIFCFLSNMDSIAMHGDVLGKGNSLLTYSLPFSRLHLWNSRRIIVFIMYAIPAIACFLVDRSNTVLLYTDELILLTGVLAAAACLRDSRWFLYGGVLGGCGYIIYFGMHISLFSGLIYTDSEDISDGSSFFFILLMISLLICTVLQWRQEGKIYTKGDRR